MTANTVSKRYQSEYEIKRSRFIAVIAPTGDGDQLEAFLNELARQHPQATHLTFAWRILTPEGLRERCHDAGEPSGTAGRPILSHLQGKNLINVCLAVVRYFGGTKLGAGGLARAYGQAARQVLEIATIQPHIQYRSLKAQIDYRQFQNLSKRLAEFGAEVENAEYGTGVTVTIRVPETHYQEVQRLLQIH